MIHAIVFSNRGGYRLTTHTAGFPASFTQDIYDICIRLKAASQDCAPVLRYGPLQDRYLLSVIFRFSPDSADNRRSHVSAVNFLLEADDADQFFSLPLPAVEKEIGEIARSLLMHPASPLPGDTVRKLLTLPGSDPGPQPSDTPLRVLLAGAVHGINDPLTQQLFLQTTRPPLAELYNLIRFLPRPLRRQLRFHTGCIAADESEGLSICYSPVLDKLTAGSFSGGPSTSKFWFYAPALNRTSRLCEELEPLTERLLQIPSRIPLYAFLQNSITDWNCYQELSLLVKNAAAPALSDVLQVLPAEAVAHSIRTTPLSDETLDQLGRAARRIRPVRDAVKACRPRDGGDAPSFPAFLPIVLMVLSAAAAVIACIFALSPGGSWIWYPVALAAAFCTGFLAHRFAASGPRNDNP